MTGAGMGTGFRVAAGVLTSAHVIGQAKLALLVTSDGSTTTASVSRMDPSRDLALLATDQDLPSLDLAPAGEQHLGDQLFVLSYPPGLDGDSTLSRGIVSAIHLDAQGLDLLQTDAAVAEDDAGGPVLNANGNVVGLLMASRSEQGLKIAVATESINKFLAGAEPLTARSGATQVPAPTPAAILATTTSRNWAGYVATSGKFTSVSGTWIVPQAASSNTPSAVSTWVGIGGVSSADLLEVGTSASVGSGGLVTYQALMELLPARPFAIQVDVHPGDEVSVTIAQQGPQSWRISFTNHQTGQTFDRVVQYASTMSSAEWVQGLASLSADLPLTSFDAYNSVSFSNGWAIKDGQQRAISELAPVAVIMTDEAGNILARPAALDQSGSAFAIARVPPIPPAAPPAPTFHGTPDSIIVQPGDLGSGWTISERQQEQPNAYSSGKLSVTLQQGNSAVFEAEVEVFKDIPTADAAWQQRDEGDGQRANACDAETFWMRGDSVKVNCRVANVEILLFAPTIPVAFSALQAMLPRVRAALRS